MNWASFLKLKKKLEFFTRESSQYYDQLLSANNVIGYNTSPKSYGKYNVFCLPYQRTLAPKNTKNRPIYEAKLFSGTYWEAPLTNPLGFMNKRTWWNVWNDQSNFYTSKWL